MTRHYLQVYLAKDGPRWRKRCARNGQIVATSHEAFYDRSTALRAALRANPDLTRADVREGK